MRRFHYLLIGRKVCYPKWWDGLVIRLVQNDLENMHYSFKYYSSIGVKKYSYQLDKYYRANATS